MKIEHFFDETTNALTYAVYDAKSKDAVIIDPVLGFDYASGKITVEQIQKISDFFKQHELYLHFILETHVHADHLSSAAYLKKLFPSANTVISKRITTVQKTFQDIFNLPKTFATDGSQFDKLLEEDEILMAGTLEIKALKTGGHTPCSLSYLFNQEAVFTGDALFMPDYGTGRCDFPGGDARQLYRSICEQLYRLPSDTRVFVGHDYMPKGRSLLYQSTIQEEKANNIHLTARTSEAEFVLMRETRDKTLSTPKLFYPSLQVNIQAGNLPKAESNGMHFLKIPLTNEANY